MNEKRELRLEVPGNAPDGWVSALVHRPPDARWLLVLGHGAGAGMRHPFMEEMARTLTDRGVATLRYQFPYMERRERAGTRAGPDRPAVLTATVRAAVEGARALAEGLPLLAGGKSMGGRMTSLAASEAALPDVRGLVFFGFPLHAAGRPSADRAEHLARVPVPMLFLQGTRDRLADLALLRPVLAGLGERATLHVVDTADHSFKVTRGAGRTEGDVRETLARAVAEWAERVAPGGRGAASGGRV